VLGYAHGSIAIFTCLSRWVLKPSTDSASFSSAPPATAPSVAPPEPELDLSAVEKYVGFYLAEEEEKVEILIHDGRLAIKIPQAGVPLELYPPDEEGKWFFRLNPTVSIDFRESEDRQVLSFTSHSPEGDFVRPRVQE